MYKGKRDPMLGIVIRQSQCFPYVDKSGREWIEIFIPYRNLVKPGWTGSIMVEPEHVYFIDDIYNEFFINAGAEIKIIQKVCDNLGNRHFADTEIEISEMILTRILQYEAALKHPGVPIKTIEPFYENFIQSGLTMYNYIQRM